ncbi:MAG: penicillin-insensitive murein endopeptidase [Pseudomonadota bacterium]
MPPYAMTLIAAMALVAAAALSGPADAAEPAAKDLFGRIAAADSSAPAAIGSYARGCLAGGRGLAQDGDAWQAMRLSRNRHWGHPSLVDYVERLAATLKAQGHSGLLVGDMAQPRGGPMLTGHASHQIGLDVDLWFRPMPDRRLTDAERESISAISLLREGTRTLDPQRFAEFDALRVVRTAAIFDDVARIFVHPAIKRGLCEAETGDRRWLRKVRPWWGHHYHFHVRLSCPADSVGCQNQAPPPPGDGCGSELAWWFTDEPWTPSTTPAPAKAPLRLADLPNGCRVVVSAP